MPFTNVWDDTFPPDTQLANLLGQDLRNFRLDVQQRMAAISGLDASKPAFGGDAQPANWNGVLFFATDTGNIYQWTNPVWNQIFNFKVTKLVNTSQPFFNSAGTTTLLTIPAGNMTVNSHVRIAIGLTSTGASISCQLTLLFGGNVVAGPLNLKASGLGVGGNANAVIDIVIKTLTSALYGTLATDTPGNVPTAELSNSGNSTIGLADVSANSTTFQINVISIPSGSIVLDNCVLEIF